jgi:hypothetical protein
VIDTDPRDAIDASRRRVLSLAAWAPLALCLSGCGGASGGALAAAPTARSWRMGFYPNPPNDEVNAITQLVDAFSQHGELLHIHEELPWTELLAGQTAESLAMTKLPLVNYARSKSMRIGFMGDLTDGLDRAQQPPQLRALGRSIEEPQVQAVFRAYLLSVAQVLQPDYIGLTAETNLVRLQSPADVYGAMVETANASAADLIAAGVSVPLMISVQVEVAWGQGSVNGQYQGVDTDFTDFPFMQMLGLSSYPYFFYPAPEQLPTNYYSRLLAGRSMPAMVAEGGWSSANVGSINSSQDIQRRYIELQGQMLDGINAVAVVQTLFADLDLSALSADLQTELLPFASIGLAASNYSKKPALDAWDVLFARPLKSS